VLFSTESKRKATGSSSGDGYVISIMTSVRSGNDAPPTQDGLIKIPVDLNEGAGGKYIYFYYRKGLKEYFPNEKIDYICELSIVTDCCLPIIVPPVTWDASGKSIGSGGWTDLNQGAGGDYIYLVERREIRHSNMLRLYSYSKPPIRDILVISSNKKLSSYPGWILIPTDLNKGAGGKWIYLCYKY